MSFNVSNLVDGRLPQGKYRVKSDPYCTYADGSTRESIVPVGFVFEVGPTETAERSSNFDRWEDYHPDSAGDFLLNYGSEGSSEWISTGAIERIFESKLDEIIEALATEMGVPVPKPDKFVYEVDASESIVTDYLSEALDQLNYASAVRRGLMAKAEEDKKKKNDAIADAVLSEFGSSASDMALEIVALRERLEK